MKNVTPRAMVLRAFLAILSGETLTSASQPIYDSALSAQDKAFARTLLMACLRRHGELDAAIAAHLTKPLRAKLLPVQIILRMGLAQLWLLKTPAHAAIDSSVELCKREGFRPQAGLVNAVLRKLAKSLPAKDQPLKNIPAWLADRWRIAYGKEALACIAEMTLEEPSLDLILRVPHAQYDEASALLPGHRRIGNCAVESLPGYAEGAFWVQDIAASIPVRCLGEVAGKHVLDACAAPGGKTLQLCAAGAETRALDVSTERLGRLQENLQRAGFAAERICADLLRWTPTEPFPEIVLFDAPCSATGTFRRHPDIWLLKTPELIVQMAELQRNMLTQMMRWLPVGARLLYCVCSLEPEEAEAQMRWLEATYGELEPLPLAPLGLPPEWYPAPHQLRLLPHYWQAQGGMDGFFIAQYRRLA